MRVGPAVAGDSSFPPRIVSKSSGALRGTNGNSRSPSQSGPTPTKGCPGRGGGGGGVEVGHARVVEERAGDGVAADLAVTGYVRDGGPGRERSRCEGAFGRRQGHDTSDRPARSTSYALRHRPIKPSPHRNPSPGSPSGRPCPEARDQGKHSATRAHPGPVHPVWPCPRSGVSPRPGAADAGSGRPARRRPPPRPTAAPGSRHQSGCGNRISHVPHQTLGQRSSRPASAMPAPGAFTSVNRPTRVPTSLIQSSGPSTVRRFGLISVRTSEWGPNHPMRTHHIDRRPQKPTTWLREVNTRDISATYGTPHSW